MSTIKYKGNTYSGAANITDADHVDYDNTSSGLTATSVQDAIDELSDGAPVVELTLAQYNALTPAEQNNGTVYYITDDNGTSIAEDVMYDNSDSGLTATNVQDAVDELNSMIDDGGTSIIDITQSDYDALSTAEKMDGHIYCITDGTTTTLAEDVGYDNTDSGLTATNVQDAVDEVSNAENVSYDNTESGLTATDVQGALDEVRSLAPWTISTDLTIKNFNDFPANSIYHLAGTGYQNSPVASGTCYGVVETIAGSTAGYRIQTASLISNGNISKISTRSYAEGSWYPWHDIHVAGVAPIGTFSYVASGDLVYGGDTFTFDFSDSKYARKLFVLFITGGVYLINVWVGSAQLFTALQTTSGTVTLSGKILTVTVGQNMSILYGLYQLN